MSSQPQPQTPKTGIALKPNTQIANPIPPNGAPPAGPGVPPIVPLAPPVMRNLPLLLAVTPSQNRYAGGEAALLVITVRNPASFPQLADLFVRSSLPGLLPNNGANGATKISVGLLPPDQTRTVRLTLRAPVLLNDTDVTIRVRAGAKLTKAVTLRLSASLVVALEPPHVDLEAPGQTATFRLHLTNHLRAPLLTQIHAAGVRAVAAERLVLSPDKPAVRVLTFRPPTGAIGNIARDYVVDGAQGRLTTVTAVVGVPILCHSFASPPALDGKLDAWADSEPMGMGREEQTSGKRWRGPGDLSAIAYVRWDTQYLYFACAVTDDTFTPPANINHLTDGDALRFAISLNRSRPETTTGYQTGDAEFGLALVNGTQPKLVRLASAPPFAPGAVPGARLSIQRDGKRLIYQVVLPWSELMPTPPPVGTTLGFSILVHDNDEGQLGTIAWGGGIAPIRRPASFSPIRLVP